MKESKVLARTLFKFLILALMTTVRAEEGERTMVHTYEVFVDIKEFGSLMSNTTRIMSERYEINARSLLRADDSALERAKNDHPQATEFDVRITRLLH
ncbi:hypothetical protein [Synechococcus sp. PCC 7336]|uniref:hypothetical protein n=1 Tax=Synechococcus sp. PCC 7336 TaxID=195250 RepID=UPI00036A16ED|nr:hypothetical protein [Synechococcus sp. PCC 7336]